MIEYVDNKVIQDTFPEEYNIIVAKQPIKPYQEVDEMTGLPLVEAETIFSKYGLMTYDNSSFHRSLREFFDRTGFLTPKQVEALRKS
jgi:hypothetical protein